MRKSSAATGGSATLLTLNTSTFLVRRPAVSCIVWLGGTGFCHDDIAVGAIDNRLQFRLLCGRHAELVERLLEIIHEGLPLFRRNVQVTMRVDHGTSGVFLWSARCHPHHLGDQILEACGRHAVMRFVHRRVRVQARVGHNAVDEIIDHCGDVIDSTKPLIKAGLRLLLGWHGCFLSCLVFFGNEGFVAALTRTSSATPPLGASFAEVATTITSQSDCYSKTAS